MRRHRGRHGANGATHSATNIGGPSWINKSSHTSSTHNLTLHTSFVKQFKSKNPRIATRASDEIIKKFLADEMQIFFLEGVLFMLTITEKKMV
jgi:hypothetical protein